MAGFAVTEIFCSIQGESTGAGRPCVFVRFTGCDLRCGYCDTAYAFHGGTRRSADDLLAEISRHPARYVTLTGGEPLLQRELPELAQSLLDRGYEVAVETHGQVPFGGLPAGVARIVDVKTPGSGEQASEEQLGWLSGLGPRDELKFVICDEADFRWSVEVIRRHSLERKVKALLFSPVHGLVEPEALARWLLASGVDGRLQLQLHKLIWGATARGV